MAVGRDWRDARSQQFMEPVRVGDTEVGAKYEAFEFVNGRGFVHRREVCAVAVGESCIMHNPSDHGMRALPMLLRDTTLVERLCPHGIGHPDPDSASYFERNGQPEFSVHGCDGCCSLTWVDTLHIECPECGSPMMQSNVTSSRWTCLNFGGCELSAG